MVRDDPDGNIRILVFMVRHSGNLAYPVTQRLHRIHIKDGVHVLYHHRQTLKSHAGIDIFLLQLRIISLAVIVKLGEHIVPDFHIAIAVAAYRTARFPTAVFLSPVIINL